VLRWLVVALLLGIAALVVRWATHRPDTYGRRPGFPTVSVAVLAVVAVLAGVPVVRHARQEALLDRVATVLVGTPVTVHCQTLGESFVDATSELGYVRYRADGTPEHAALLKREQCQDLARYAHAGGRVPDRGEVVAVHVLTHEAMHMAGLTAEAAAECAAVQRDAWTARLLGASTGDARRLAAVYWRTDYPRLSDDYRTPACGPGRSLDEHRADAPWSGPAPTDGSGQVPGTNV